MKRTKPSRHQFTFACPLSCADSPLLATAPSLQAAPYAGVALGSGLIVYAIQQRRLNNQLSRNHQLQVRFGAGPDREAAPRLVSALHSGTMRIHYVLGINSCCFLSHGPRWS